MCRIKIGIIEDEMVISDTICLMLREMGYALCNPASTCEQAMKMIESERPDLLLLNIHLADVKGGVDPLFKIREVFPHPIIYLIGHKDTQIPAMAEYAGPNAYLVKPFTRYDLLTAIEIAISNFYAAGRNDLNVPGYILVKNGYQLVKLFHYEILYLENKRNYIIFHTIDDRRVMARGTMPDALSMLNSDKFLRHHRSFSVNLLHLKMVETEELILNGEVRLPLAAAYKLELLNRWK